MAENIMNKKVMVTNSKSGKTSYVTYSDFSKWRLC